MTQLLPSVLMCELHQAPAMFGHFICFEVSVAVRTELLVFVAASAFGMTCRIRESLESETDRWWC